MLRKFVALMVMLSVFWQSASFAGAVVAIEDARASAHAVLHWQDSDHHHHEDGSLHHDDSAGTIQHMHAESGANSSGVVTAGWNDIVLACTVSPTATLALPYPLPFIQGLPRPPATRS